MSQNGWLKNRSHKKMSDMPVSYKRHSVSLMQSVIWPAVAGNIIWSFLSLLIDTDNGFDSYRISRLLILLLLSIYLILDWLNVERCHHELKKNYWIVDFLLAISIAFFALSVQYKDEYADVHWLDISLTVVYLLVLFGHSMENWVPDLNAINHEKYVQYKGKIGAQIGAKVFNIIVAIIIIWQAYFNFPIQLKSPWNLPASLSYVLLVWAYNFNDVFNDDLSDSKLFIPRMGAWAPILAMLVLLKILSELGLDLGRAQ